MSIFSHINNSNKLNELFNSFTISYSYRPLLDQNEKKISVSNNNEEKTHLLFKKIVERQSSLNEARLDPQSQVRILEHLSEYTAITDTHLAVHNLKRKFNKLFLENLLDADK